MVFSSFHMMISVNISLMLKFAISTMITNTVLSNLNAPKRMANSLKCKSLKGVDTSSQSTKNLKENTLKISRKNSSIQFPQLSSQSKRQTAPLLTWKVNKSKTERYGLVKMSHKFMRLALT